MSPSEPVHESLGADPDLRQLVELCVARHPAEGGAVVDELSARYPRHATQLRRRVAILERAGLLDANKPVSAYPEQLGDFRLGELLGEGGMGAVFRAQQVSLGRPVALKVIRAEQAYSPRARERFQREIEAIAALRSPGIVQVYTVGEQDGVAYFAMELVDGVNLADLVLELRRSPPDRLVGLDVRNAVARVVPGGSVDGGSDSETELLFAGSYVQVCCRIIMRVARTLAHAHERGVLHRDVKPSNIMLDRSGRVLLLDFGLARVLETQADGLTVTGGAVGSPAYMAPEQMRGERELDARVDVYGLGITLYELLTHRGAFRADTQEDLREKVLAGAVVSPTQLNPAILRDAETICLKAMAHERGHRYATAAEFADDLQRFLELRPIEARRAGLGYRLRRWAQRRPALATAIGACVVIAVGGPLALAWQQSVARRAVQVALEQSQRFQRSYEAALQTALSGMERTAMRLCEDEELASGRLDPLRRDLLRGAASFYSELAAPAESPPAVQLQLNRARTVQAKLQRELGDREAADVSLAAAVDGLEVSSADVAGATRADRVASNEALAAALHERARLAVELRDYPRAVALWERSIAVAQGSLDEAPSPPAVQRHIARCRLNLAQVAARHGDHAAAERGCREVIAMFVATPTPADEELSADARMALASALMHANEFAAAITELEQLLVIRERRVAADPQSAVQLRELYSTQHNLGFAWQQRRDMARAAHHLEAAAAAARRLHAAYPERVDARVLLAQSLLVFGNVTLRRGDPATAEAACREAVEAVEGVAARDGVGPEVVAVLAESRGTLAQILLASGRSAEAVELLRAALGPLQKLADRPAATPDAIAHVGTTCGLLASALKANGDMPGARAMLDRALDALRDARARDPRSRVFSRNLASTYGIAIAHLLAADDDAGLQALMSRVMADPEIDAEVVKSFGLLAPESAQRVAAARAAAGDARR